MGKICVDRCIVSEHQMRGSVLRVKRGEESSRSAARVWLKQRCHNTLNHIVVFVKLSSINSQCTQSAAHISNASLKRGGPLVITVYWQLGVCNSSLLKCSITSNFKCVHSSRPGNTVPPLTIPVAFCSRTGELQRRGRDKLRQRKWILFNGTESIFLTLITFQDSSFFFFNLNVGVGLGFIKIYVSWDMHWNAFFTLNTVSSGRPQVNSQIAFKACAPH